MATVKATDVYLKRARRLLPAADLETFHRHLALHPDSGDIVAGTGGVRKVRWGMAGQGKRGGIRALHLYLRHKDTVWLLDMYAKRAKVDLTPDDVKMIRRLVQAIKETEERT